MSRIVLSIQRDQSGAEYLTLLEPCGNVQSIGTIYRFNYRPPDASLTNMEQGHLKPGMVKQAGAWLFQKLVSYDEVRDAITHAENGSPSQLCPIYIQFISNDSDNLPWETLCNGAGKFLALNRRLAIGRIAGWGIATDQGAYPFELPVKVMLVLSAAGISAQQEWDAFYSAVTNTKLRVKLRVLVSEDTLLNQISAVNDPNITLDKVDYVPGGSQQVLDEIEAFVPNILHFFCHGSTVPDPHLLIATHADYLYEKSTGKKRSSIALLTNSLNQIPNDKRITWLITLNCCLGAAAAPKMHSLASSLVANGFPVVVGMREVIASTDAHIFCQAFYQSAFDELRSFAGSGKQSVEISWARVLHKPRVNLGDQYAQGMPTETAAAELKEWTLPVIYEQRWPFRLQRAPTNEDLSSRDKTAHLIELTQLRDARTKLAGSPGLPPGVIAEIDERIRELESRLFQTGG